MPLENGGGTLNLLRKGFSHLSAKFRMCEFKPESTLNEKRNADYAAVRVRVMRQVHFSTADQRSVDLVFFVNGCRSRPLELKTDFTQTVAGRDQPVQARAGSRRTLATRQVQPLFVSGARALVHFAVSNDEVWMTTSLAGEKTHFLPFNRGHRRRRGGQPAQPGRFPVRLSVGAGAAARRLAEHPGPAHVHQARVEHAIRSAARRRSQSSLRFPRFHQWEAVTELTAAVDHGRSRATLPDPAFRRLGKTDSIAWTAHRMARLQVDNKKVFDSVIVVTDRNVLDAQLQDAIKQIDNDQGIVVAIDHDEAAPAGGSKSGLLAKALTDGKLIIVVTIQTFPFAMEEIRENKGLKGKTFAVIADEAHSSQSGQVASKLKAVLTAEELKDIEDGGEVDIEAVLAAEATERADSANISYFAFTATPKAKTLELFGRTADGDELPPVPFHVYTMQQAIEEGYILDVLTGYHSFNLPSRSGRTLPAARRVDQAQATKEVMRWVKLNPQTIAQKAAIIVEHFRENVAHLLDGHAKAMVVTDSRKAAVRYKLAIDEYIAKKGYGYGTLVAFSGTVQDPESGPGDFTEANDEPGRARSADLVPRRSVQGHDRRQQVPDRVSTSRCCARCTSTGSCPGVTAVQTLSRLNRTYRTPSGIQKTAAMTQVVDFVNEPERSARRSSRTSPTPSSRPRPTRTWSTTWRPSSTHAAHLHAGRDRPVR